MNRLNFNLFLILVLLLIYARADRASITLSTPLPSPTIEVIPTPTPIPRPDVPITFNLPKIQVIAPIDPVGTDENGKMQLPQIWDRLGWYSNGYRPGEKGNAVVAGHLDSTTGAGAIFYYLNQVEPGDEIITTDASGKEYYFVITHKVVFPYDQVPIDDVFGPSDAKRLNLITCTGWWNASTHNYSHRLIVYSELQE